MKIFFFGNHQGDGEKKRRLNEAGVKIFCIRLGRGLPWFPDEQPSAEIRASVEKKLNELNWDIDFVLSHTCPTKYIPIEAFLPGLSQNEVDRSTENWLDSIEDKLSYTSWYCGHWHINKRIDKMHFLMECKETLPIVMKKD